MTGESVEQAALRRANESIDWKGRAEREAAAIIAEACPFSPAHIRGVTSYETLVVLVAVGWLQGVNFGSHRTLASAEATLDLLREAL